jgi:formylglycine-generating enzyme required for sulfatase activity
VKILIKGNDKFTDKTEIFISYAREDLQIAKQLYRDLKREGFLPWLDKENLLGGQNWPTEISKAIKKSSFFLALLSSNSLGKRGYVQKELKIALDIFDEFPSEDIFLIPVYADACEEALEERLKDIHGIVLHESYEEGLKQLLRTLYHYGKDKSTATARPVKKGKLPEQQSFSIVNSIDEIIKKREAEEKRKKQIQKDFAPELEKYKFLLNSPQYTQEDREMAWQFLCSKFAVFTQGVEPEDIWELKFRAGSFKAGEIWKEPTAGIEFVWVPQGRFMMGSDSSEAADNEYPVHEVCLDSFWIGKFQLTQGQYEEIMGTNHSNSKSGDYPVERVSWNDAKEFIEKFNQKTRKIFFLPTEAQWEYAARSGGKDQKYAGGNDIDKVAWYGKNSDGKTHAAGMKAPNDLGIYDMSGNVWEWCEDAYDSNAYKKHKRNNPMITTGGSYRVVRGGSWFNPPRFLRTVNRDWNSAGRRSDNLGFRLCLSPVRFQETRD